MGLSRQLCLVYIFPGSEFNVAYKITIPLSAAGFVLQWLALIYVIPRLASVKYIQNTYIRSLFLLVVFEIHPLQCVTLFHYIPNKSGLICVVPNVFTGNRRFEYLHLANGKPVVVRALLLLLNICIAVLLGGPSD